MPLHRDRYIFHSFILYIRTIRTYLAMPDSCLRECCLQFWQKMDDLAVGDSFGRTHRLTASDRYLLVLDFWVMLHVFRYIYIYALVWNLGSGMKWVYVNWGVKWGWWMRLNWLVAWEEGIENGLNKGTAAIHISYDAWILLF